jgi:hypothetical protein
VDEPPPEPESLLARPGAFADTLTWARTEVPDFSAYRIERSYRGALGQAGPDSVRVELGRSLAAGDTVWIDEDVSPGHLYEYAVRIEDDAGQTGEPATVAVRTAQPSGIALGFEPRRSFVAGDEPFALSLWVAGALQLHGIVLQLHHGARRVECRTQTPFGDPTLAICLGDPEGPTDLALSGVRGGPTIEGFAVLADLVLSTSSADPESIAVVVQSLAQENGNPVEGAGQVVLRTGVWEPAP